MGLGAQLWKVRLGQTRMTTYVATPDRTGQFATTALFIVGGMFGGYLLFQALGIGPKPARG